jgi:hypothetical protein
MGHDGRFGRALCGLLAAAAWCACGGAHDETAPPLDPKVLAPDFVIGQSGPRKVTLHSLRGRPVVLAFTLSGVDVCADLQTCLATLFRESSRTAMVVVAGDTAARPGPGDLDPDSLFTVVPDRQRIFQAYKIDKVPTVVIIDRRGAEVFRHAGFGAEATGGSILKPKLAELAADKLLRENKRWYGVDRLW